MLNTENTLCHYNALSNDIPITNVTNELRQTNKKLRFMYKPAERPLSLTSKIKNVLMKCDNTTIIETNSPILRSV